MIQQSFASLHRNDQREIVKKFGGRLRPKERGMVTDIVFNWKDLTALISAQETAAFEERLLSEVAAYCELFHEGPGMAQFQLDNFVRWIKAKKVVQEKESVK